jgi:ketosteroid isomerase-like protein
MKTLLVILSVFLSVYANSQTKDDQAVRQLLNDQSAAWHRGDIETFMKGYWENDSLMFIGKSGITYGWSNTLSNYKKGYPDTAAMGKLTFALINLKQLSSEYFHVTGKWHLQRSIGNLEGHFTLLFKKIKGQWVIIADHSS